MPRLRTTSALSLAGLLVGVLGTAWLSERSGRWEGAPPPVAAANATTITHHRPGLAGVAPGRPRLVQRPALPASYLPARPPAVAGPTELPSLHPLSTPMQPMPYWRLRQRSGLVELRVRIDGEGRVDQAELEQSSGDAVLDDYARNSVYGWRFEVPAQYPQGVLGAVSMRFEGESSNVALAPP